MEERNRRGGYLYAKNARVWLYRVIIHHDVSNLHIYQRWLAKVALN
jgi:hypothetical protein